MLKIQINHNLNHDHNTRNGYNAKRNKLCVKIEEKITNFSCFLSREETLQISDEMLSPQRPESRWAPVICHNMFLRTRDKKKTTIFRA